jgi:hypothetical protein
MNFVNLFVRYLFEKARWLLDLTAGAAADDEKFSQYCYC